MFFLLFVVGEEGELLTLPTGEVKIEGAPLGRDTGPIEWRPSRGRLPAGSRRKLRARPAQIARIRSEDRDTHERISRANVDAQFILGHTEGMKVAVSLPDRLFEAAELLAKRRRVSRSRVYAEALEEFVRRERRAGVREALDAVYGRARSAPDPVLTDLQAEALREEW